MNKIKEIMSFAKNNKISFFFWVIYESENNEIKIIDSLFNSELKENMYCNMKDAPAYNQYAEKAFLQFKGRCESLEDSKTETLISIVTHLYNNRHE